MIRNLLFGAVLACALPALVLAQDAPAAAPQARSLTPDQMLRFYDAKLILSDDQKTQLLPILADRQQKVQDLRADTSARPMMRMKKAKEIESTSDAKINAILTPDQRKKYAELEAQVKEQAKERRKEKN